LKRVTIVEKWWHGKIKKAVKQSEKLQKERRNTMHKYTRSILGNPSQQGKKTQPNPLLYSSRERPSPPRKPSTQEGACKP
jgi:hypothetical protein